MRFFWTKTPKEKADRLIQKGDRLLAKGKTEKALKKYRKALSLDPENQILYEKLVNTKQQDPKEWKLDDFVESMEWVLQGQQLQNPELKKLYEELKEATETKMKIIALTGGFATGKTAVAEIAKEMGVPYCSADTVAHQMMEPHSLGWKEILNVFGNEILEEDQTIHRKKLAHIVFNDTEKRKTLEQILHPKIRIVMNHWIEEQRNAGHRAVVLEIPLLFETGWEKENRWDALWVVTCSEAEQIRRGKKKGYSEEETQKRIQAQQALSEKEKRATIVIYNDGPLSETKKQVESLLAAEDLSIII